MYYRSGAATLLSDGLGGNASWKGTRGALPVVRLLDNGAKRRDTAGESGAGMHIRANHPISRYVRLAAAGAALACLVLLVWSIRHRRPVNTKHESRPHRNEIAQVYARNTDPGVRYVGDAACESCHPRISASYHQHPMGRSLRRLQEV